MVFESIPHMALLTPMEPSSAAAPRRFALWNLGFRPFYLLAGLFATLSVAIWMAQYSGWLAGHTVLAGPLWHAHEMIFGYALAVIVGFLFTAGRNWANQPTPAGLTLAAIASLWVAGRVLVLTPYVYAAAAADTAFVLAAAAGIAVPFLRSGNRRNYFFIYLLLGMGAANLLFHLAMAGLLDLPLRRGLQAGLDIVLFIMTVMGGRVIPMFTMNGVPGVRSTRVPLVERVALGSVLAMLAADVVGAPAPAIGLVAAVAAVAHGARLGLWRPWLTFKAPVVWILHCAYAWIVVALAMRALAAFDLVPDSIAAHALTVGAIGGLTLGMMTRTSRGHTGRTLSVGRAEIFCYVTIQLAALTRVFLPLAFPSYYLHGVILSGVLWSLAFGVFTATYWPVLTRPRLDGAPG